jgi:hypothetical protein
MKPIICVDPAATSDRAALCAAYIDTVPQHRLRVVKMVALEPPITQDDIVRGAEVLAHAAFYDRPDVSIVVDVGGALGVVAALCARFGARSVLGLRITAALEHALQPEPLLLSRAPPLAVACWHVSRSRVLDDLRRAAGSGVIHLPTKDEGQRAVLHELRREMEGIAEQVSAAGRVLGVADGGDDLVLALSYSIWALNGALGVVAGRGWRGTQRRPVPSAAGWA